jgi:formylglycine-generating enzyme required for sulfatase activity
LLRKNLMPDSLNENIVIEATPFERVGATANKRSFVLRPIPILMISIFAMLGSAAIFLFSARAVSFQLQPEASKFTLTSGFFAYKLGERYLMLSGDYSFQAETDGYHPLEKSFEVGEQADQIIKFEFRKLPGILTVATQQDSNSELFVDQQYIGYLPLTIETIEPGVHDIHITSERFQPFDSEITIEGQRIEQSETYELTPAWANISFDSSPTGAVILASGAELGRTPQIVEILQGTHQVSLKKQGYKSWETVLDIIANEDQTIPAPKLVPADGKISIVSNPEGANVTISGQYSGQTPLDVSLRPGKSYRIILSRAGFEQVTQTIRIEADEDIAINRKLKPILGIVSIQVEPEGAELFINGELQHSATQRLSLTARTHQFEIRKAGYATHVATVTPRPGFSQQLLIKLQTENEAQIAAISPELINPVGQELKLIIPGKLKMGASRREPGRRSNEIEKQVELRRPYYLSTKEVTNAQYLQFDSQHDSGVLGRALLSQEDRPVVNLTWEKAARFCNWMSEKQGLPPAYEYNNGGWRGVEPMTIGYRLPTEAEWVWAARYAAGPNTTRFPWGDNMPPVDVHANYADEAAANMVPYHVTGYSDNFRGPAPTGSYKENEFGIFDLAGNVSEWIHDFYSLKKPDGTLTDPLGPRDGDYHVIRGSNYTHGRFSELRWTFRDYGEKARTDVGFRVGRYVE